MADFTISTVRPERGNSKGVTDALLASATNGTSVRFNGAKQFGGTYGELKALGLRIRTRYVKAEDATYAWAEHDDETH